MYKSKRFVCPINFDYFIYLERQFLKLCHKALVKILAWGFIGICGYLIIFGIIGIGFGGKCLYNYVQIKNAEYQQRQIEMEEYFAKQKELEIIKEKEKQEQIAKEKENNRKLALNNLFEQLQISSVDNIVGTYINITWWQDSGPEPAKNMWSVGRIKGYFYDIKNEQYCLWGTWDNNYNEPSRYLITIGKDIRPYIFHQIGYKEYNEILKVEQIKRDRATNKTKKSNGSWGIIYPGTVHSN